MFERARALSGILNLVLVSSFEVDMRGRERDLSGSSFKTCAGIGMRVLSKVCFEFD